MWRINGSRYIIMWHHRLVGRRNYDDNGPLCNIHVWLEDRESIKLFSNVFIFDFYYASCCGTYIRDGLALRAIMLCV